MESEYVALCDLTCEMRYLRQLAKGLGFHQKESILCVEDNKRTIITTENKCSVTGHMKHVDVKFRFVQESIKMGEIRIRYISTELNWEDVLTYRLIVSEKGTVIQNADSYFMLEYV